MNERDPETPGDEQEPNSTTEGTTGDGTEDTGEGEGASSEA